MKSIKDISKESGIPVSTIYHRLHRQGLTLESAVLNCNLSNKKNVASYLRMQAYKQLKKDYEYFKGQALMRVA